ASDRLQLLVVQRLQELAKTHIAETAYKIRTSIGKAIQKRSSAIRTALERYNTLAAKMDPPATQIKWDDIIEYTFLSELDILKHSYSQANVREQPWAQPINRDAATKHFKILRAREEITRLNVEAGRLRAWVLTENADIEQHEKRLKEVKPPLSAALAARFTGRIRANKVHLAKLNMLECLPGYTG
ncbi:hypothetical protein CONPUDRAFT_24180, partial [Coniophora puteana RWD-64-598 SS2]